MQGATVGWEYDYDGGNKKGIQDFGAETSLVNAQLEDRE
jgi:hypothetical protein